MTKVPRNELAVGVEDSEGEVKPVGLTPKSQWANELDFNGSTRIQEEFVKTPEYVALIAEPVRGPYPSESVSSVESVFKFLRDFEDPST